MLKSVVALLLVMVASYTHAMESIDLVIPAKPGGYAHRQAEVLKKIAESQGVQIDIKFTGTCQNAARIWQQGANAVLLLATHIAADPRCGFGNIEKPHVLTYLQHMPMMICHRRDRSDLGIAHFINKDTKKTLGVISYMRPSLDLLVKRNGYHATKVMAVGISSDLRAATFLNEIDYFLLDPGYASKHADRISCMANTTGSSFMNTAGLDKVFAQWDRNEIYVSHMIASRSPASAHFRTVFTAFINSKAWDEYLAAQPGLGKSAPDTDHHRFYSAQSKIFAQ